MKLHFAHFDLNLIIPAFLLLAFSLLMISSTSQNLAIQQLIFLILGMILFFAFSRVDYRYFKSLAFLFWIISFLLLIILPFVGEEIRGSVRWIDLGFFRFQPSEISKLSLILVLSALFSTKNVSQKNFIKSAFLVLPIFFLILRQPDLGNAIIILFIYFSILFTAGFSRFAFLLAVFASILLLPIVFTFLAPYQKERVFSFIDPAHDPLGTGYSVIQSQIAIGSGQIFGRGFGRGSQSHLAFLPERQTDFVFATLSEELGFVGSAILISLFVILLIHVLDIAKLTKDLFGIYTAIGFFGWFFAQITINIGMNLGIFPVTGITLPLISYGGSSLISLLLGLAILSSISRSQKFQSQY